MNRTGHAAHSAFLLRGAYALGRRTGEAETRREAVPA